MKKVIALFMVMVCVAWIFPATAQAAEAPAKVTRALNRCVDDNGRCIVIDHNGQKMYLFKRNCKSGKWELKKSFRCVCGDYLNPGKHYLLLRSEDIDLKTYKEGAKTYHYGVYIDCYEDVPANTMRIHSYAEIKGKTYKDGKKNDVGFAVCIDNAYYIWKYYGDGTAVMGC